MLNGKQKKALAALMRASTNRDAARLAGVSESTIQRYLTIPEFKAEYMRLSNELLNDALINAEKALDLAFTTLSDVCGDETENGQTKVSAARAIIEYTLRVREIVDIDIRLQRLERNESENINTA